MPMPAWKNEWVSIGITGVLEGTDRKVGVRLENGRELYLPRKSVEFMPGCVLVPAWLHRKIIKRKEAA